MAHPLLESTRLGSPIVRAELAYQHTAAAGRRGRRFPFIFGIALAAALLSSLGLLFAPALAAWLALPLNDLRDLLRGWFGTLMIMLGALIMLQHLGVVLGGAQLAAASVAREKQGRTWESLVLTGIDARRIIMGKWAAVMQTLWRGYRSLLFLRFGVALWVGVAERIIPLNPFSDPPPLAAALALAAIVALLPLAYGAFAAALGLLASVLTSSPLAAQRLASTFLAVAITASLSLIFFGTSLLYALFDPELAGIIPGLFMSPIDGGMLALIGTIAGGGMGTLAYLLGMLICVILYPLLALLILWLARAAAVRQHALPPA